MLPPERNGEVVIQGIEYDSGKGDDAGEGQPDQVKRKIAIDGIDVTVGVDSVFDEDVPDRKGDHDPEHEDGAQNVRAHIGTSALQRSLIHARTARSMLV